MVVGERLRADREVDSGVFVGEESADPPSHPQVVVVSLDEAVQVLAYLK